MTSIVSRPKANPEFLEPVTVGSQGVSSGAPTATIISAGANVNGAEIVSIEIDGDGESRLSVGSIKLMENGRNAIDTHVSYLPGGFVIPAGSALTFTHVSGPSSDVRWVVRFL